MSIPASGRIFWPSTFASIPVGWSEDTSFSDRFLQGSNSGYLTPTNSGTISHTHIAAVHAHVSDPHNHIFSCPSLVVPSTFTDTAKPITALVSVPSTHGHLSAISQSATIVYVIENVTITAQDGRPEYLKVIVIKPNDGNQLIPNSGLVYTDLTTNIDGFQVANGSSGTVDATDRFLLGTDIGGDGGPIGGSGTHLHSSAPHTHNMGSHFHTDQLCGQADTSQNSKDSFAFLTLAESQHHNVSLNNKILSDLSSDVIGIDQTSSEPEFIKLLGIQNISGNEKLSDGVIIAFVGAFSDIPTGWTAASGTYDRQIKTTTAISMVDQLGGSQLHTHISPAHTHTHSPHNHLATQSNISGGPLRNGGSSPTLASVDVNHNHIWTVGNTTPTLQTTPVILSNVDGRYKYRTVLFIKFTQQQTPAIQVSGSSALFIQGVQSSSLSTSLFINGDRTSQSSDPLFITGHESLANFDDLFIGGIGRSQTFRDMTVRGIDVTNNDIGCILVGSHVSTSTQKVSIHGYQTSNDSISLLTAGHQSSTSFSTLFINGYDVSQTSGTLFIDSHRSSYDTNDLFIRGISHTEISNALFISAVDLVGVGFSCYVGGSKSSISSHDLFIGGHVINLSSSPLYIEGYQTTLFSKHLFISGKSRAETSHTLFVDSHQSSVSSMDLLIAGVSELQQSHTLLIRGIDLDVLGVSCFINGSQSLTLSHGLFIDGHQPYISSSQLFQEGYKTEILPHPLFIGGKDNTHTSNVSGHLYLYGYQHIDAIINANIIGCDSTNNIMGLVLTGSKTDQRSQPLYIHGLDIRQKSANLSVHGSQLYSSTSDLFIFSQPMSMNTIALLIRGTGIIGESGILPCFINGIEPRPSLVCPALDSTASIQLTDSLIHTYQSRLDAIINQLGKNVLLEFDPIIAPCPNCSFDLIRRRSTGVYKVGGPRPFIRGRQCPWCKGHGLLETSVTKCIQCLVQWSPEDDDDFDISLMHRKGVIRLKTHLSITNDLIRAKTIVANYDIANQLGLRATLIRGPFPLGLREDRYSISFWGVL